MQCNRINEWKHYHGTIELLQVSELNSFLKVYVSQEFVLGQHCPLNIILARFKDSSAVLCIDSSGEMGKTEMAAIACLHAQLLSRERIKDKQEGLKTLLGLITLAFLNDVSLHKKTL